MWYGMVWCVYDTHARYQLMHLCLFQANHNRDSLAKTLYSRMLSAIVRRCNCSRKSTPSEANITSESLTKSYDFPTMNKSQGTFIYANYRVFYGKEIPQQKQIVIVPYNIYHKYVVVVLILKRYLNLFVTVSDGNTGTNERVIAFPNIDVQDQVFGIADLFGFERPNVRHSLFCQ